VQWVSSEIKLKSTHCARYGQTSPSGALTNNRNQTEVAELHKHGLEDMTSVRRYALKWNEPSKP